MAKTTTKKTRRPIEKDTPQSAEGQCGSVGAYTAVRQKQAARRARREPSIVASGTTWGRALHDEVPPTVHGEWKPAADRPDPVGVLDRAGESAWAGLAADPLRPDVGVGVRVVSRGAAAGMAADLADTPSTGIVVQLCGDGHIGELRRVRDTRAAI